MRVGIDTSPLVQTRAGTARHVRGLLAELAGRPGLEPHEVEIRPPAELGQQSAHVARSPRACLDKRRDVDPDPHSAALRTISFGSG